MKKQVTPEWSFLVDVESIGNGTAHYSLCADAVVCELLAERFEVRGIENLSADIDLSRERGGLVIRVSGHVCADVLQSCVVTLEPMSTKVSESFEAFFSDPEQAISFAKARTAIKAKKGDVEVEMMDETEAPEDIIDGKIDLGEVAAQFLSLGIPAYPRLVSKKEGEDQTNEQIEEGVVQENPFAALKAWKDGLK